MRAGRRFIDADKVAVDVIGRELLKRGAITKKRRDQVVFLVLLPTVAHPLGLQTHDVFDPTRVFEPGMVTTDERGTYVRKDDVLASETFEKLPPSEQASVRAAVDRFDGIGVRIEDDVLITDGEPSCCRRGRRGARRRFEAAWPGRTALPKTLGSPSWRAALRIYAIE